MNESRPIEVIRPSLVIIEPKLNPALKSKRSKKGKRTKDWS